MAKGQHGNGRISLRLVGIALAASMMALATVRWI